MAYGYGYPYRGYYPPAAYRGYPGYRSSAPASVHTAAILIYLGGLLMLVVTLLAGLVTVGVLNPDASGQMPAGAGRAVATAGALVTGVLFVMTCCYFILGRKLQRGRQWARVLVLLLTGFALVGIAVQVFQQASGLDTATFGIPGLEFSSLNTGAVGWATIAGQAAGPLLFILLLNTRAARSWFSRHTY